MRTIQELKTQSDELVARSAAARKQSRLAANLSAACKRWLDWHPLAPLDS
jgi:hypothetical protein